MIRNFTTQAMKEFLSLKGWFIEDLEVEEEVHIHGSRFLPITISQQQASKDGDTFPLETAFAKELKQLITK